MDVTNILQVAIIFIGLSTIGLIFWLVRYVRRITREIGTYSSQEQSVDIQEIALIFTDEFKEELRSKGRARFDEVMKENSLFLEQDLRLSSAQLNKYLEETLKTTLQVQLGEFQKSVEALKQTAVTSMSATQEAVDQSRVAIEAELEQVRKSELQRMVTGLEKHLGEVISRYIKIALGEGIDEKTQTEFVLKALEGHKDEIRQDIIGHVQSTE